MSNINTSTKRVDFLAIHRHIVRHLSMPSTHAAEANFESSVSQVFSQAAFRIDLLAGASGV
jgi:hypothetical protein